VSVFAPKAATGAVIKVRGSAALESTITVVLSLVYERRP
jgi:hypothetical protein